jgi:predicted HTH domain antitoxin
MPSKSAWEHSSATTSSAAVVIEPHHGGIMNIMAHPSSDTRTVQVDLPAEVFHHSPWDPEEIAEEMRLLWLLEQVRQRRLAYGKAAELAGIPVARFLRLMGKYAISPFDYDPGELEKELSVIK